MARANDNVRVRPDDGSGGRVRGNPAAGRDARRESRLPRLRDERARRAEKTETRPGVQTTVAKDVPVAFGDNRVHGRVADDRRDRTK